GPRGFGGPVVLEAQSPHASSFVQQESTKSKGCFPCMLMLHITNNTFNIENVGQYCILN
ncbi:unnamed protein product, partial [Callosobruchus maculatus]